MTMDMDRNEKNELVINIHIPFHERLLMFLFGKKRNTLELKVTGV